MNHWRRPKRRTRKKKEKSLPRVKAHRFVDSGDINHAEVRICTCGSLEPNRVHGVPEISDDERELSARIIGEGGKR